MGLRLSCLEGDLGLYMSLGLPLVGMKLLHIQYTYDGNFMYLDGIVKVILPSTLHMPDGPKIV